MEDQFLDNITIKHTDYGLYLESVTDVCKYGQAYPKDVTEEAAREKFIGFYHPIFLDDMEAAESTGAL